MYISSVNFSKKRLYTVANCVPISIPPFLLVFFIYYFITSGALPGVAQQFPQVCTTTFGVTSLNGPSTSLSALSCAIATETSNPVFALIASILRVSVKGKDYTIFFDQINDSAGAKSRASIKRQVRRAF